MRLIDEPWREPLVEAWAVLDREAVGAPVRSAGLEGAREVEDLVTGAGGVAAAVRTVTEWWAEPGFPARAGPGPAAAPGGKRSWTTASCALR